MVRPLYDASPSLIRINPLGTTLAILLVLSGLVLAIAPQLVTGWLGLGFERAGYHDLLKILGLVVFAVAAIILMIWWIPTRMDRLTITGEQMIWTHGLIAKQYTEIHLHSIHAVRVNQTLTQRLFGVGDIMVYTSGDEPELVVEGLPRPRKIRRIVKASGGTTH